jgi:hypothetical protein
VVGVCNLPSAAVPVSDIFLAGHSASSTDQTKNENREHNSDEELSVNRTLFFLSFHANIFGRLYVISKRTSLVYYYLLLLVAGRLFSTTKHTSCTRN